MTTERLPTVAIVSASIGAGHDGAAAELARRLVVAGFAVRRHDFLDLLPPGWGERIRSGYARQLRYAPASWGWLLRAVAGPRACGAASAFSARTASARIAAALGPDLTAVVSTYPLAGQALGALRRSGQLRAPVASYLTDPSVHPLCVAPGVDRHLAPGAWALLPIRELGGAGAVVVRPVTGPAFRPVTGLDDAYQARVRLGLPLIDRLAVIVAGSWGVGDVERTVRDVLATGAAVPVVVCGRNDRLRRRLAASGDVIVLGWVDDMPSLLRAADVVVHNAGGLSSMEALACGAPVVSYRCLPGHGTANAAVLAEAGLSPWPRDRAGLAGALAEAIDGDLRNRQAAAYGRLAYAPDPADLIAATAEAAAAGAGVPA